MEHDFQSKKIDNKTEISIAENVKWISYKQNDNIN